MDLSIILPVHNEEDSLEDCVESTRKVKNLGSYEIIIMEDGSTDRSRHIAAELESKYKRVRLKSSKNKLGRGKALKKAFNKARGEKILYMDVDMAVSPIEIHKLVEALDNSADLAIGSRYIKGSAIDRDLQRKLPSKIYNLLARNILGTEVLDHQCGFKAVKADAWNKLSVEMDDEAWFFDTELIFRAKSHGLEVKEVPIKWEEKPDSTVNLVRDGLRMGEKILKLRFERSLVDVKYFIFAMVGSAAGVLNTALLYVFTDILGLYYILSSFLALEIGIIGMFFANNRFTFDKTKRGFDVPLGLLKSNAVRSFGILTTMLLLFSLTEYAKLHYIFSNIIALFAGSIVNFIGEKKFNWKE